MSRYLDAGPAGVGVMSVTPVTAGDPLCETPSYERLFSDKPGRDDR